MQSQTTQFCGTEGLKPEDMRSLLDEYAGYPQVASSGAVKVGVWFYHVRKSNGTLGFSGSVNPLIQGINGHFNGVFEFIVCGETYIDDDTFFSLNINNNMSPNSEYSSLLQKVESFNEPNSPKCVRIFTVGDIEFGSGTVQGYALDRIVHKTRASAIVIANSPASTFSHELGHYFGLPHTYFKEGWQNNMYKIRTR